MPHDEPMSFAEAIRRDVIENGAEGLNPGDRERILAEEEARKAAHRQELENMVDASLERARQRGDL
ncbi:MULTISPECIES: hypothetical protein [Deinococcus]|uniref:Uncharacterized protein n=1 Tax=Deinococcus rufus TaxID=2136097 RepID=A0ABV7Z9X9_9DEIO|nr:hypothetical protein [Deinococcus sp. AB2017081]WQE97447.1 hypothetical protein U2P90_20035 [Deinococcus sp. AB2017081]WQE97470.1 hypothetical protein U2P90_19905 [Deinococcus sp. AB2017081]